ncbi:MAG: HTH domain-containing protein [Lachnospiraceae bacterium]|nr:HTH domain-containing protein [Lachnospiraceae bacterium]
MLSIRQKTIIQCILGHPEGIFGSQLSKELRVSGKTIRNDIADMNARFREQGLFISASQKNGYFVKEENREQLIQILERYRFPKNEKESQTPQERRMAILDRVLGRPGSSIEQIAETLCVSEQTIYKDLAYLEKMLEADYDFCGMRVQSHRAVLLASELEIRKLVFRLLTSCVMKSGLLMDSSLYQLMRGIVNLNEIHTFYDYTVRYCRERRIPMPDSLLYLAAWMIFYTNVRREEAFFLEPADGFSRQDELAGFLNVMNQELFLEMEDCDLEFLYQSLACAGFPADGMEPDRESGRESQTVRAVVCEFFEKLQAQYSISAADKESRGAFVRDMACLLKRVENGVQFQDFPGSEPECPSGCSFQAAMIMAGMIRRRYPVSLTGAEIRRIAGYVSDWEEKRQGCVRIQMISSLDHGRFCQVRRWIQEKAGPWVEFGRPCPRYLLEEMCRKQMPDLLIAAEAADIQSSIPLLILSGSLTEAEGRRLTSFLKEIFRKKQLDSFFAEVLTGERVLFFEPAAPEEGRDVSWKGMALACCHRLEQTGCVEDGEGFCRELLRREEAYPSPEKTEVRFLFPYERTAVSDGVSIGIRRGAGTEAGVVFAAACSPQTERKVDAVMAAIQKYLKKQEALSLLLQAPDAASALAVLAEAASLLE